MHSEATITFTIHSAESIHPSIIFVKYFCHFVLEGIQNMLIYKGSMNNEMSLSIVNNRQFIHKKLTKQVDKRNRLCYTSRKKR